MESIALLVRVLTIHDELLGPAHPVTVKLRTLSRWSRAAAPRDVDIGTKF